MPNVIKGLEVISTGQFVATTEYQQKQALIKKAFEDGMSTAPFSDQINQKEGVVYRNPNIQTGTISFWSHPFMTMGA